jgi:hypothetical protein
MEKSIVEGNYLGKAQFLKLVVVTQRLFTDIKH